MAKKDDEAVTEAVTPPDSEPIPGPGNVEVPEAALADEPVVNEPVDGSVDPEPLPDPPSTVEAAAGRHPDDAPVSTDPTPEAEVADNAGREPSPASYSHYPEGTRTSDALPGTPGQESPPAYSGSAPLVPPHEMVDRDSDPTATLQQANDPVVQLSTDDSPSLDVLVAALDQAWSHVKSANWNVDPSSMDLVVAKFRSHAGHPTADVS